MSAYFRELAEQESYVQILNNPSSPTGFSNPSLSPTPPDFNDEVDTSRIEPGTDATFSRSYNRSQTRSPAILSVPSSYSLLRQEQTPSLSSVHQSNKKNARVEPDSVESKILHQLHQLESQAQQQQLESDEEGLFSRQVAAALRRFNPHQKAFAKLKIQQVLFDVELSGITQESFLICRCQSNENFVNYRI